MYEFKNRNYPSFGYFLAYAPIRDKIDLRDQLAKLEENLELPDRNTVHDDRMMVEAELWVANVVSHVERKREKARAEAEKASA